MSNDCLAVLDFGSQYAHLIAKRLRRQGFYTEIHPPASPASKLAHIRGLILSGGPASVYGETTPDFNQKLLELELPILGLCYGHQLTALHFGGTIQNTGSGEFGKALLKQASPSALWKGVSFPSQVWMSHQDSVTKLPKDFEVIAQTEGCPSAALQHQRRPVYTLQFHPEVKDTVQGSEILTNFAEICGVSRNWSMKNFINQAREQIQTEVGSRKVLMFLSGGVDSSVSFALLNQALGTERVLGLYMDNGFMRKEESEQIMQRYREFGYTNIEARNFSSEFLKALEGLTDPQKKRHQVGAVFIQMRERFLQQLDLNPEDWMLGQGTLYPDIIESGGSEHANVIKSHHNRVEEVVDLMEAGQLVEPLKDLYKDEVRELGSLLGLPDSIVWRHPFPGPGLSVNVLCSDGTESVEMDRRLEQEILVVLPEGGCKASILPVRSVGVQGDQRTYTPPAVLWETPEDWNWLEEQSIQVTNAIREVNRVVMLLSPSNLPPLKIREAYCTKERLDLLREADALVTKTLIEHDLMRSIFQLLVILLPLSQDGQGDSLVLRPVCSEDVMTAQFARLDWKLLRTLQKPLLDLSGIDAVFYDITHKPPATFGWE
ncbi:MAG: glutamine-hydrolyzing GMP synthase [SAR324 cluster bacterium]|nr:glutamine-hydrolyzing GMP synthase [SAR324 cluster bacterium]